jgi:hypothetical protein
MPLQVLSVDMKRRAAQLFLAVALVLLSACLGGAELGQESPAAQTTNVDHTKDDIDSDFYSSLLNSTRERIENSSQLYVNYSLNSAIVFRNGSKKTDTIDEFTYIFDENARVYYGEYRFKLANMAVPDHREIYVADTTKYTKTKRHNPISGWRNTTAKMSGQFQPREDRYLTGDYFTNEQKIARSLGAACFGDSGIYRDVQLWGHDNLDEVTDIHTQSVDNITEQDGHTLIRYNVTKESGYVSRAIKLNDRGKVVECRYSGISHSSPGFRVHARVVFENTVSTIEKPAWAVGMTNSSR